MIKLTQAEKEARGTAKKSTAPPRSLREIKADLTDTRAALRDTRFAMKEAGESIRKDGIWLVTWVYGTGGDPKESKKANPMIAIHSKCLSTMKVLKRSLVLLNEELAAATNAAKEASEFDEFV